MEAVDYILNRIRPIDVAVAFVAAFIILVAVRMFRRAWQREKDKK